MIIFYGIRSFLLKTLLYPELKCQNCGNSGTLSITAFQRYFHIFWIPFFPVGKVISSTCSHCKQVLDIKELPPTPQDPLTRKVKTPWYSWIGLVTVFCLVSVGVSFEIYRKNVRSNHLAEYFAKPQLGDVYTIKNDDDFGYYSLYKIVDIQNDVIYFQQHEYSYEDAPSADSATFTPREMTRNQKFPFSKTELKALNDEQMISDIDRE